MKDAAQKDIEREAYEACEKEDAEDTRAATVRVAHDAIYLQDTSGGGESVTWSEDKIFDDDLKYICTETLKKRFKGVINGNGLVIPRIAIRVLLEELYEL